MNPEWVKVVLFFVFAEDLQHESLSGSVGDIGGKEKTQAEDEG